MAIHVQCPSCGNTVAAPDSSAGKVARCGGCRELIDVPVPENPPAESPLFEQPSEWLAEESEPQRPRAEPVMPVRRRRPRPRSAPKSTRWVLWLVGGIAAVLLIGCGAIGFAVWHVSKPKWETHEPAGGGFRVELPAPPRDMARLSGAKPEPGVQWFGTVRSIANEEYGVIWADIEPWKRQARSDNELLDEAVSEMMKDQDMPQKISERPLTQNGFPAREVVLRSKTFGTGAFRVIIAESRLYIVVVAGGSSTPNTENAQRFLNSFEITDQQLFAARDRRLHPEREIERLRLEHLEAERKAEEARAEAKRMADEAEKFAEEKFPSEPYDGPKPPDPATLPDMKLLIDFNGEGPQATVRTKSGATEWPLPAKAFRGPGVRGEAIYLPTSTNGLDLKDFFDAATYSSDKGQTLSIWLKARKETVYLFMLRTPAGAEFTLRSSPIWLGAFLSSPYVPPHGVRIVHNTTRDDAWHHYAFVRRPDGGRGEQQLLYIDGDLVGEHTTPGRTFLPKLSMFEVGRVENGNFAVTKEKDPLFVALDELVIYDRACDAATIKHLAGRGPKPGE